MLNYTSFLIPILVERDSEKEEGVPIKSRLVVLFVLLGVMCGPAFAAPIHIPAMEPSTLSLLGLSLLVGGIIVKRRFF